MKTKKEEIKFIQTIYDSVLGEEIPIEPINPEDFSGDLINAIKASLLEPQMIVCPSKKDLLDLEKSGVSPEKH